MDRDRILKKAEEINEELIAIRRDIHMHPEIGFNEKRTGALVAERLKKLGMDVQTGIGKTGVVGTLKGKYPGKTILLRADMDCLPIKELNDFDYKSKYDGLMHACGHDAHTTWLLGAAMILSEFKNELHGNVKFAFQPSEESEGGAQRMIEDGLLENPKVDAVIGGHVWDIAELGKIGVRYGSFCAAPDDFKVVIKGKGGHGAMPHLCIDPISVGYQVYMGFQNLVARKINPVEPVVLTVGKINSGTAFNVIPDELTMEGTVRTLNMELRDKMPEYMEQIISGICSANGAEYEFNYRKYYPPVINNDDITKLIEDSAVGLFAEENVVRIEKPVMGGEDFSYYQLKVPGSFFIVGIYNEVRGYTKPLHNAKFNFDEDVIHKASALMAACAVNFLNE